MTNVGDRRQHGNEDRLLCVSSVQVLEKEGKVREKKIKKKMIRINVNYHFVCEGATPFLFEFLSPVLVTNERNQKITQLIKPI